MSRSRHHCLYFRHLTKEQDESTGPHIPDPHWLVPVNIVSLVIAILANASLLGQMTNRLRYNISGPITIVGFYISGLVDIALVGAASTFVPLPPDPQATYSQAFYYAAFSGAIYLILAMLLSVTAWGIWFRNYATQFKLSLSQRSLMLQTVFFLSYTLIAAEIYSVIEGWQYLDGVYFVVVTLFTIGFGDLVPRTHLGRSLFFPFAVGGILFVGVIIGNIRTVVLESGSVKVSTRLVEKARFQAIQAGNPEEETVKLRGLKTRTTKATTELKRREKEFEIMREIQSHAATNNKLVSLAFSTAAFMILWFIGAVAFWKAESTSVGGQNWSYFESLYFTYVAQLTIGYGDFEPQTNSAKPTFVFWALIALPTLTVLIGAIGDVVAAFTNWYTAWLGKNAQNLYSILEAVWQPHNKVMDNVRRVRKENSEKSEEDSGLRDIADISKREAVPQIFATNAVTSIAPELAEDMYRPFVMLKAAHTVMGHLDETPPRKYTYEEWTWLLSLIGEDEADHRGHRRVAVPLPDGLEVQAPMNEKHQVWSWLGQESPLLSLEDG